MTFLNLKGDHNCNFPKCPIFFSLSVWDFSWHVFCFKIWLHCNFSYQSLPGKVVLFPLGYLHISTLVSNLLYSQFFSDSALYTLNFYILCLPINLLFNHIYRFPRTFLNFSAPSLHQSNWKVHKYLQSQISYIWINVAKTFLCSFQGLFLK